MRAKITVTRIGGLALAALAGVTLQSAAAIPAQAAMVQSVSIGSLRSEILSEYDRNRNNVIDIARERVNRENPSASFQTMAFFLDADGGCDLRANRREITRLLRSYDANRNGKLGGAELVELVARYGSGGVVRGAPAAATKFIIDDAVGRIFCTYDHNGNGVLDIPPQPDPVPGEPLTNENFNRADPTVNFKVLLGLSDGVTTSVQDQVVTGAELVTKIRELDVNLDGAIENTGAFPEFAIFVSTYGTGGVL